MRNRPRLLVPAAMSVLALAALVFAIAASKSTRSGSSGSESSPAVATGGTVPAIGAGGTSGAAAGSEFEGAALPRDVLAPPFSLKSLGGGSLSLASLRGKPVLLAFLYSHCGAPCMLIAQQIRGALDDVGPPAAHAVIVSADPRHDDAASVKRFLSSVSLTGRVAYLTGSQRELEAVWSAYRVKPAAVGRSVFSRYATVLLIDARGRERVVYGSEQLTPEALVHDIGRLQNR